MKVCWVKIWIASMATLTERFRDDEGRVDFEALGREEYAFRHALITGDYYKSERARDLAEAAEKDYKIHSENGKKGGRPKKLTAAATTREGVDVVHDRESGSLGRATNGCNNKGECNTASTVPAVRPESGKVYDQETYQVSTKEALDKPGAGEVPPESASAKPSPALPVPAKKAHGEFGNVMLTDDEFAKLCEKCPDADALITELDQYIESQGKTKKYKSHYATLLNWSRRKAQEAKQKKGYKTAAEKDADVLKELAEYYDKMEAV